MHHAVRRVLVIDDDASLRDLLTEFLWEEGFDVRCAADGLQALLLIEAERPDVVLLDLMMPVLGGDGFLATCERDARLQDLPVVVLSAGLRPATSRARQNVRAWLSKPFQFEEVVRAIDSAVETPAPRPALPPWMFDEPPGRRYVRRRDGQLQWQLGGPERRPWREWSYRVQLPPSEAEFEQARQLLAERQSGGHLGEVLVLDHHVALSNPSGYFLLDHASGGGAWHVVASAVDPPGTSSSIRVFAELIGVADWLEAHLLELPPETPEDE
jgi:CheY-like chemotaxis protein